MAFRQWNGHEVDTQGDAFFVVFARAIDASMLYTPHGSAFPKTAPSVALATSHQLSGYSLR